MGTWKDRRPGNVRGARRLGDFRALARTLDFETR
jgi:hypothetical protein